MWINKEELEPEQLEELNQVYSEIFSALQTIGKDFAEKLRNAKLKNLKNKWLSNSN